MKKFFISIDVNSDDSEPVEMNFDAAVDVELTKPLTELQARMLTKQLAVHVSTFLREVFEDGDISVCT